MKFTRLSLAAVLVLTAAAAPARPGEDGPAPAGKRGPMDRAADGQDQIRKDADALAARLVEPAGKLDAEAVRHGSMTGFDESMNDASGQMGRAGGQLREGVAAAASGSQSQAVEHLLAARAALRMAWEAAQRQDPYARAAGKQDELSRKADDLARRLAELGRHLESARSAGASVGKAGGHMQDAHQALGGQEAQGPGTEQEQGHRPVDQPRARSGQQQAVADLGSALDNLRHAAADAPAKEPSPGQKREQLAGVARNQAATRAATEKLQKLIEEQAVKSGEPKLQDASDHAGKSAKSQQEAEGRLEQGRPEEARDSAEDALDELEAARNRVRDAIDRARGRQRQEELFRIEKELQELLAKQLKVNAATVEVENTRAGKELGRPEEARIFSAALEESDVLARTRATVRKLTDSPVFAWVMDDAAGDVGEVRDRLDRRDTGAYTQEVGKDVVRKFEELIDVLRKEQQAPKPGDPPDGMPPGGGPPPAGKPPLVPPLAEIRLIRRMQGDVNDRTRRIDEAVGRSGERELNGDLRAILERVAQKQGDVARVTGNLAEMIDRKAREPRKIDTVGER